MGDHDYIETLAEAEHSQWSKDVMFIFNQMLKEHDLEAFSCVSDWQKTAQTAYADLEEPRKERLRNNARQKVALYRSKPSPKVKTLVDEACWKHFEAGKIRDDKGWVLKKREAEAAKEALLNALWPTSVPEYIQAVIDSLEDPGPTGDAPSWIVGWEGLNKMRFFVREVGIQDGMPEWRMTLCRSQARRFSNAAIADRLRLASHQPNAFTIEVTE